MSRIELTDIGSKYGYAALVTQERLQEILEGRQPSIPPGVSCDMMQLFDLARNATGGHAPIPSDAYCAHRLVCDAIDRADPLSVADKDNTIVRLGRTIDRLSTGIPSQLDDYQILMKVCGELKQIADENPPLGTYNGRRSKYTHP
jgi:hypothetical protein